MYQLFLLKKLRDRKFPYEIPVAIKNRDKRYHFKLNKQVFFVYNFINGATLNSNFTYDQAEQLGIMVGRYHNLIGKNFYRKNIRKKGIFDLNYTIGSLLKTSSKIKKKYAGKVFNLESIDVIAKYLKFKIKKKQINSYKKLKQVPCHSDWNGTNLIVNKSGKITGLIDFGGIHMEPKIFDFQNAILYAALSNFRLDLTKIKKFCKGFFKKNKLTSEEINLIYPTMLADLAFTVSWIFEEKFKNKNCRIPNWDIEVRLKIFNWLLKNEKLFKNAIKYSSSKNRKD